MRHSLFFLYRYFVALLIVSIVLSMTACAQKEAGSPPVQFIKHVVSSRFVAEGVATGDVNKDGKMDILAGNYWFEAPSWKPHLLHADTLNPIPGYSTSFINFSADVNNDGWIDLIRFDEPGGICAWYQNPGTENALWQGHTLLQHAGIETPLCVDVDGDGRLDIICNDAAAKEVIWLQSPVGKGDTVWQRHVISHDSLIATDRYTHGLGWGDVNKDGRNDVIVKTGWWEAPADVKKTDWTFHPADLGEDCANMLVYDVDGDGDNDIISSSAHKYGIWWHEQVKDNKGNTSSWVTHEISTLFSQSHALVMHDLNGDGYPDLVTGKRYLAHQDGHDPGSYDGAVLYWFQFIPGKQPRWVPHLIDDDSGIGNRFVVTDMNGDHLPDIVVSNKKGVFFFEQVKRPAR